jgi:hypothetical protein
MVPHRDGWIFDKSRKPVYVDFTSWFLVLVFERLLTADVRVVVLEEALPAPDQADPAVTEFLLELTDRSGHA